MRASGLQPHGLEWIAPDWNSGALHERVNLLAPAKQSVFSEAEHALQRQAMR